MTVLDVAAMRRAEWFDAVETNTPIELRGKPVDAFMEMAVLPTPNSGLGVVVLLGISIPSPLIGQRIVESSVTTLEAVPDGFDRFATDLLNEASAHFTQILNTM